MTATTDTNSGSVRQEISPPDASERDGSSRGRSILVNSLIGLTTVLLVLGMFSVWANRLLFSPDNWSSTSTQLLANPAIRATTANYVVDQLYSNVDVPALISSDLPPQFQKIAGPVSGALRTAAVQGVELALTRPRIQNLWANANRAADETFVAIVRGGKGPVALNNGVVTLNLSSIIDNVAVRLGLPADLGAKLPANIGNLTVLKSNQLSFVQKVGNAIQGLALWLTILVPLLYGAAILLARGRRRRKLMTVGFAGVLAGVLVLLGRSILETQVTSALTHDASLRSTISAVISINTEILGQIAAAVIGVSLVLIGAAWFAGPARVCTTARRAIAPFLRDNPLGAFGSTIAVMVLIFIWDPIHATGTPAGIITFTLLALLGTEILRRQTADEFPDARHGEAMQAIRARIESMRHRREPGEVASVSPMGTTGAAASAAAGATTAEQLTQLFELHSHGAITAEEYQTAKEQLLHT